MSSFLFYALILFVLSSSCYSLQCLDESGNAIDWFFVYKVNKGLSYSYYDAKSTSISFSVAANKLISDKDTAIGATLSAIWPNTNSYDFIAYNDEPPDGSSGQSYGHTKGVLTYDGHTQSGYFLIHSWPKFPNFYGSEYNVNDASDEYAQTYLCISYKSYATMNSIAYGLRFNKPKVYNSLSSMTETNNFTKILDKDWLTTANIYSFESLSNSQSFSLFSKSQQWNNELYEYLVSPHYKQSFAWETWRRSPQEPSFCEPEYEYDALNVENVTFGDGTYWHYTQDHGKSGCSLSSSPKAIVCVGDINRMYSQYSRGGGTCCFEHLNLWKAFSSAFKGHDSCNGNVPKKPKKPHSHKRHHHHHKKKHKHKRKHKHKHGGGGLNEMTTKNVTSSNF